MPGTLAAGLEILAGLPHPFARAVFLHVLLSDVHPFADGNGRISRIMMTRELVGSGLSRIVVPTVYRDDYLGGLRALSRHNDPTSLVRTLDAGQKVTAACAAASTEQAIHLWASVSAFAEPGVNARLDMPDVARAVVWRREIPAPGGVLEGRGRAHSALPAVAIAGLRPAAPSPNRGWCATRRRTGGPGAFSDRTDE